MAPRAHAREPSGSSRCSALIRQRTPLELMERAGIAEHAPSTIQIAGLATEPGDTTA